MIPTSLSSSSPPAVGNIANNSATSNGQSSGLSAMIGIASLILEGRAIADDEVPTHTLRSDVTGLSGSGSVGETGRQSPKPSTSKATLGGSGSGGGGGGSCGIEIGEGSGYIVKKMTNPSEYPLYIDPYVSSSDSTSSSAESNHSRWTQKLSQLRQESPSALLHVTPTEHKVAVDGQSSGEPEYVMLAINRDSTNSGQRGGDFEIVRRTVLNRVNLYSSSSGICGSVAGSGNGNGSGNGSSTIGGGGGVSSNFLGFSGSGSSNDHFLHSLQSLATSTCLRVGSPSRDAACSNSSRYNTYRPTLSNIRFPSSRLIDISTSSANNNNNNNGGGGESDMQTPLLIRYPNSKEQLLNKTTTARIAIPGNVALGAMKHSVKEGLLMTSTKSSMSSTRYPQQGPHCDQFLRKMGLAKADGADFEEHHCDMSYVNITCTRWRAYCLKMEAIIARSEPVCIEVYLGPVGHKILLEQWIITQKEKVPPPTMTLPSLCSAIRSQLYFSQISAWCDLITKSDKTIYDTGRLIFPNPTCSAGDLATNAPSLPSPSPLGIPQRPPRLNIFYRITQYDSTACFNSKPNVHNFPNVNISENCSVSVCLKSLPRITGGIPKIDSVTASGTATASATASATSTATAPSTPAVSPPATARTTVVDANAASAAVTKSKPIMNSMNCDKIREHTADAANSSAATCAAAAAGAAFAVVSTPPSDIRNVGVLDTNSCDDENCGGGGGDGDSSTSSLMSAHNGTTLSHREKQLLKYRKRIQRRDKKCRKHSTDDSTAPTNSHSPQRMEQGEDGETLSPTANQRAQREAGYGIPPLVQMISTGTQTQLNSCVSCGGEQTLVCLKCNSHNAPTTSYLDPDEMDADGDADSTTSSLSSTDIIHVPRSKAELLLQAIQRTPKAVKKHKKAKASEEASDEATMRAVTQNNNHVSATALPATVGGASSLSGCQVCKRQKTQHNFSQPATSDMLMTCASDMNDDKVTRVTNKDEDADEDVADADGGTDGGKTTTESLESAFPYSTGHGAADTNVMEEEYFESSTKFANQNFYAQLQRQYENGTELQRSCTTPPTVTELLDKCDESEVGVLEQFKTPTSEGGQQHKQNLQLGGTQPTHSQKLTSKPIVMEVPCNYWNDKGAAGDGVQNVEGTSTNNIPTDVTPTTHNPLLLRRSLPKVNLTPIFCNSTSMLVSAPIPISSQMSNGNCSSPSASGTTPAFSFESPVITVSTQSVQKSNSAPTLPNSPSLSPRFVKATAIYKRRSRHLSDRSDRSSLGSDEQFSDEDLESGLYSPYAVSPIKLRSSRLATVSTRLPLLGNLEESLLQRRIVPKIEVTGFKLLLGASGGFCPTQLTIPAAAYFYELPGSTLSTPYLCEIRLPRKGYSVPRTGTVQATLLNPMGTVVRMFVIPYDMRDMPALHQTFIRQRILADTRVGNNGDMRKVGGGDGGDNVDNLSVSGKQQQQQDRQRSTNRNETNLGHFISTENMKSLRYSIHLRFQTSRSGRLMLHTDIRLLISRRTDCDTAAAHAKGVLEAPNELVTDTVMPTNPKYSARQEQSTSKI